MNPQDILSRPAKILSNSQRQEYFDSGYLLLPGFLDKSLLKRIVDVADAFVEESKHYDKSDAKFDLEPSHSAEAPRVRRLSFPVAHHEVFKSLASCNATSAGIPELIFSTILENSWLATP